MASFHNWTGDEEIATQVPQFLNEDNAATQEKLDIKFNNSLKITGAADLNSFKDEGLYYCNSNSQAETILNCPTNYAFGLMVWGKEDIFYQEVREFNRGSNQDYNNCWRRSYYSEGGQGVWSNWQQMSYVATTLAGYGITDGMSKTAQNTVSTENIMKRNVNNSSLRLMGGINVGSGASLQLCGSALTGTEGHFSLMAVDSAQSATLKGSPSGLLKWNNKNIVRSINNVAADENGNVNIVVSGGGSGGGSNITVDEELSSTSTNPVQNKVIYNALLDKVGNEDIFNGFALRSPTASIMWRIGTQTLGSLTASNYTGTALRATQDGAGNIITDTYTKKADFDKIIGDLGVAFQEKVDRSDLADVATSGKYTDLLNRPDYVVQSVNNIKPDSNGNVSISVEGGGGSDITVDAELSDTSTNPVQNKVVKAALDNRAVLDDVNTFTSPNNFDDIYMEDGINSLKWYNGSPNFVVASITSKRYTGEAATAKKATQDGAGNVITETYATKSDISGVVKSVNGTKPDSNGNVTIDVSGGGGGSGAYLPLTGGTVTGGITAPNFQTGTGAANYFQCQKFRGEGNANSYYHAIDFGYSGHDSVDFYEYDPNWNFYKCTTGTKSGAVLVGNINGNGWNGGARLSGTPTAPTAVAGTNTTQIATTAFVQSAIPTNVSSFTNDAGYIKSVNNTKPDSNGNVTITVSGGGGVSTSESNTWTGKQTFQKMKFNFESYNASRISGAIDNPSSSVAVYNVQGNFTLDMSTLAGLLSNGDATVFTAYITANGSYTLSITNAGTLKYAGSATDLAITANGLLLNIMLIKSSSGVLSSVAQASTLS